jgi:GNAT superfamily N-acetyltransferase
LSSIHSVAPFRRAFADPGAAINVSAAISFRPYTSLDQQACLVLFDANCPQYFAPNERGDYAAFLDHAPQSYEVALVASRVAGAYGLTIDHTGNHRLNWILLDPDVRGMGIGSTMMSRVAAQAKALGCKRIKIAASHLSAPFFVRFGAIIVAETEHGWGPGMHRHDMELSL